MSADRRSRGELPHPPTVQQPTLSQVIEIRITGIKRHIGLSTSPIGRAWTACIHILLHPWPCASHEPAPSRWALPRAQGA